MKRYRLDPEKPRKPTAAEARRLGHLDELAASRPRSIDFGRYRCCMIAHHGPKIGPEHDQG